MNAAVKLLDELAMLGATVRLDGEQLFLRAGPSMAIPGSLVQRIRERKRELLDELLGSTNRPGHAGPRPNSKPTRVSAWQIVKWRDDHPVQSLPGRCAWCREPETPAAMVVPFGTVPGTHVWLHSECWPAWSTARRGEAIAALERNGAGA